MNKGISISGRVNTTSGGGSQATDLRRPRMITPFVRFVNFNSFYSNFILHNVFGTKCLHFSPNISHCQVKFNVPNQRAFSNSKLICKFAFLPSFQITVQFCSFQDIYDF